MKQLVRLSIALFIHMVIAAIIMVGQKVVTGNLCIEIRYGDLSLGKMFL